MKTTNEKLETLEFRTESIGGHKTDSSKRGQESYKKDIKEIPVLIDELRNEVKDSEVLKSRFDNAVTTFKYWAR